ncbi:FAD/NAD(P)-binding protein, partial [Pseudomonas sp. BGM005]|nr:FAD/NAD(P)-binding protein [Pseudomonas sp. BG5]
SAIAVTCNLVELLPASAKIAVVGDDAGFGRGTAYRTELYLHRLNVPAGRMSLLPHHPDDFVDWLKAHGRPMQAGDFASRSDYGLYVRDT